MESHEPETVVEVVGLSRSFGRKEALRDVTLRVARGQVFGLVGENGAGKTTLIHHVLGAYKAKTGSVRVFGIDPVYDPTAVLAKIGYLSEDRDLPGWMRVGELMRYTQAFYPKWDEAYAERLREEFELPVDSRIRTLSRGEKAKAGLLVALAHRPELLLLDEPSSGLDAIARQDILAAVVRTVAEEGRTVVFSSHLLDEVERVADHVAMIHEGRVTLDASMDTIKNTHRKYVVRWPEPRVEIPELPGVIRAVGDGREWGLVCEGDEQAFAEAVRKSGGEIVESSVPTLEAVFVARASA
ncbi:MAG TPA: ABC transporter ATP-binding protein [Candidatus Hydrogenedentes bacterium]|nr:ABC transporter ATP-binding protein [Candidatus Hydrogenedentota bacterium]HPG70256.1 ABC transporter ATP-binding protein [Candidatus Hydrogenedentota bacterium]